MSVLRTTSSSVSRARAEGFEVVPSSPARRDAVMGSTRTMPGVSRRRPGTVLAMRIHRGLVVACLAIAGCSSWKLSTPPTTALGPESVPPPGSAKVCVIRTAVVAIALTFPTRDNGALVGANNGADRHGIDDRHAALLGPLVQLLDRIEREMGSAPRNAQWTMNYCLAEIGIRFPKLRKRAITIGETLGIYRDYPVSKGCTSPFAPIWINEIVRRQG